MHCTFGKGVAGASGQLNSSPQGGRSKPDLVRSSSEGRPCGWVTSDHVTRHLGDAHLLDWAVDAIGEKFVAVRPSTSVREVVAMLGQPGVRRVAVQQQPEVMPQGVITDLDVAALMGQTGS